MERLPYEKIKEKLESLGNWDSVDSKIYKEFNFRDFKEDLDFTNKAGEISEVGQHHPNIALEYGYVRIEPTSSDVNGLTNKDFSLARKIKDFYYSK
ncbi:MAG TPA: 4a-hydroxytetrahydrobiopterin dehydratase [Candidatus Nanoarchaeia archaeon]|nr:4a-hydroxytetrahydrobiopterin dehydratase [Candidatus Nanoarchaeia archaeon]